ncbi:hypothetical protein LCGC14_2374670 [marine sediment metagenome]|uniref:Uncharacterized protein n=1 Tax=marine sediment metagenome TaxID=412755 RepID=A0A0F9CPY6_9ZZZZ
MNKSELKVLRSVFGYDLGNATIPAETVGGVPGAYIKADSREGNAAESLEKVGLVAIESPGEDHMRGLWVVRPAALFRLTA